MNDLTIITERLIVRPFVKSDEEDFIALIRDKMASEYAFADHQWDTDYEALVGALVYFVNDRPWNWCAVEHKECGRVIGFVCAGEDGDSARNLGYTIRSDHQNNGYAYEACEALMDRCARILGVKRFVSGTADCNIPSVKLLNKLGFIKIESMEASFTADAEGKPIKFAAGKYEKRYDLF